MNSSHLLGYSAITYRSDNELTTRQIPKMLINAHHSLGLTTRLVTSKLGDHSFLSETTVDRVRKLAGSFIEGVPARLGIKIGSDHALWTCAARHASWVLNRFQPVKRANPYRVTKDFWLSMVNQFMVTSKVSTKEKQDGIYACSWERLG